MSLMASYNIVCKRKSPQFYENIDVIRLNSPWYTEEELIRVLKNVGIPKFLDINIKKKTQLSHTSVTNTLSSLSTLKIVYMEKVGNSKLYYLKGDRL